MSVACCTPPKPCWSRGWPPVLSGSTHLNATSEPSGTPGSNGRMACPHGRVRHQHLTLGATMVRHMPRAGSTCAAQALARTCQLTQHQLPGQAQPAPVHVDWGGPLCGVWWLARGVCRRRRARVRLACWRAGHSKSMPTSSCAARPPLTPLTTGTVPGLMTCRPLPQTPFTGTHWGMPSAEGCCCGVLSLWCCACRPGVTLPLRSWSRAEGCTGWGAAGTCRAAAVGCVCRMSLESDICRTGGRGCVGTAGNTRSPHMRTCAACACRLHMQAGARGAARVHPPAARQPPAASDC